MTKNLIFGKAISCIGSENLLQAWVFVFKIVFYEHTASHACFRSCGPPVV